eukprot:TRINITY_DN7523_c0_g1_i6.p1 TRINITY_DN7523_c0_g1~~TRINITY_DN7523_c0_g1_i6.p1  ORF type:complete len:135 (-),score=16.71 TRINITY_DN7523_c0_g1_i6:39-443(-)
MDVYMVSASGKIGGVNGRYVSGSTVDARKATLLICVSSTPGGTYANNTGRWIFIQDNANHIFNANSKMTGYVLGNDDSAITIDDNILAVSYTHLTLPTICSVQISVVAVSLKKKKIQNHDRASKLSSSPISLNK